MHCQRQVQALVNLPLPNNATSACAKIAVPPFIQF